MADKKNITATLEATDIGPHVSLSNSLKFSSLKIGVFANNGSGKTFLSRMFRLLNNPTVESVNKVLSINKKVGSFKFQINEEKDTGNTSESLEIKVSKGNEPEISNLTKYIYHVFNSDYVKENIEEMQFLPDGEVEGYILGKAKIDLTKEKGKLKNLEDQIQEKGVFFRKEVEESKKELDNFKVRKNTAEYKFTYTDVYKGSFDYQDDESFDDLKSLNGLLGAMPDNLEDVTDDMVNINTEFLDDIKLLLKTKYSKSSFAQEFKEKIDSKLRFVSEGISNLSKDKSDWRNCPFCEQELLDDAKKLIDDYVSFLENEESKIKNSITDLISRLSSMKNRLPLALTTQKLLAKQFDDTKKYLPSQNTVVLDEFNDSTEVLKSISIIENLLEIKTADIENVMDSGMYDDEIQVIMDYEESMNKVVLNNNNLISNLNTAKNSSSTEKLNINRRLCKSLYQKLQVDLDASINEIKELIDKKKSLNEQIDKKESQEKVSKKSKIIESLKYYLNSFFGDKYTLDEENFCLKFNKHLMTENATDILSDGEKSIVAFCFYLSDIHKVVAKETDYENLFLIIDDPISSLDFHYVYSVSQVLRSLQTQLNVKRNRFIIFTHNLEFMSLLIRNNIIHEFVILSNGELKPLSRELVMPYEEHLRDVYSVAKGTSPSHTTPNSVRHILETINRFEAPKMVLYEFCQKHEILKGNEFVYSLMHDGSHGVIRMQNAYTDEMIKKGCETVIDFVNSKYEGQINQIES